MRAMRMFANILAVAALASTVIASLVAWYTGDIVAYDKYLTRTLLWTLVVQLDLALERQK